MSSCCGYACVTQSNVGIVERFGEFSDVLPPGCTFIGCFHDLKGEVSLRERIMHATTESATEDRVILTIKSTIMFHVIPSECHTAFYSLSSLSQIRSYIESAMRSEMARVKYENIFVARQQIAQEVRNLVTPELSQRGFEVDEVLIREIIVPRDIRNASERQLEMRYIRQANRYKAEANKIEITTRAIAESEVKRLQGVGTANMQKGVAGGFGALMENIEGGENAEVNESEMIAVILMQQYFDTLKKIGDMKLSSGGVHSVFTPGRSLMPKMVG